MTREPTVPFPSASPEALGFSAERLARIDARMRADIDARRIPGAAVLIAREGRVAYQRAWGERVPGSGEPLVPDSLFRIYSMTKPIVSVATMMLAERGVWRLSDPVSAYAPGFDAQQVGVEVEEDGTRRLTLTPARQPTTLHDLLRHTSGLTYGSFECSLVKDAYLASGVERRNQTNADLLARLAVLPLAYQPGTTWEYSRSTDLLGALIEVVSGKTLGAFLQDEILGPLGMTDTAFWVPPSQQSRVAEPFAVDPDSGAPVRPFDVTRLPTFESGGGGLISTLHDYYRFARVLHNGGSDPERGVRLLSPHTLRWMTSDHLEGIDPGPAYLPGPGYGFGLGFQVRREDGQADVPGSPGDYGWSGLGGTVFWIDPRESLIVIWMMQAPGQRHFYWDRLRTFVYGAMTR